MKFLCCRKSLCRSGLKFRLKNSSNIEQNVQQTQVYRRLSIIRKDAIFGESGSNLNELSPINYKKNTE